MTTMYVRRNSCRPRAYFMIGCVLCLFLVMIVAIKSVDIDSTVSHGANHTFEAELTRKCLDEQGSVMNFKCGNRFLETCDFGDGWYGIRIVTKVGGRWIEVTCYVPKLIDKSFQGLLRYLAANGWTKFTGELQ